MVNCPDNTITRELQLPSLGLDPIGPDGPWIIRQRASAPAPHEGSVPRSDDTYNLITCLFWELLRVLKSGGMLISGIQLDKLTGKFAALMPDQYIIRHEPKDMIYPVLNIALWS
ncbi:MAG: hypothetical protein ACOCWQ_01130 [Nanoarchaeota archaeon]